MAQLLSVVFALCCLILQQSCHATIHFMEKRSVNVNEELKNHRSKRSASNCDTKTEIPDSILKTNTSEHSFANDKNPSIAMVWSGQTGTVLVLTFNSGNVFNTLKSNLYRSTNYGRHYNDITAKLNNAVILPSYGIHTSSVDTSKILLIKDPQLDIISHTTIFVSKDGAETIEEVQCPFNMDAATIALSPHDAERILVLSKAPQKSLWLSIDFGRKWIEVEKNVVTVKWDPATAGTFYYSVDSRGAGAEKTNGFHNNLFVCTVDAYRNGIEIAEHVYSFGVQGNFIFLSVEFLAGNGSRVLHVSKDKGATWSAAQIPLISDGQFYSLMDMSEEMVFVHVDEKGDNGYGSLYTSDQSGVIYSKSLDHHLYPNNVAVTDFYKIQSLPGVYITSQLETASDNVHSMITFDKGGVWQTISAPDGSHCSEKEKYCALQIHNQFSVQKGVKFADYPKSTKQAPGLILAHGNIGDGLTYETPNVYVSSDGGYSWLQPTELDGPHYYIIADRGGLLVAVKSTGLTNTLLYSFDEGQCWREYKFREGELDVTGLSMEPGNTAAEISLWGWDHSDTWWRAITINFKHIMGGACTNSDYTVWNPHEVSDVAQQGAGCLLGHKTHYKKRKKGTICVNGDAYDVNSNYVTCECTLADYLCDYGYKRVGDSMECIEDKDNKNHDICIKDEEEIVTSKYRKIPGDKCKGGEEKEEEIKKLWKSCANSKNYYGLDKNEFGEDLSGGGGTPGAVIAFIVILVISVIILLLLVTFLLHKKYNRARIRFTRIPDEDPDDHLHASGSTTLLVDDDTTVKEPLNNHRHSSYNDESDEDLLIT